MRVNQVKNEFPYLKKHTTVRFQKVFKRILWNRKATPAQKLFAMSLLTVPGQATVRIKKLARKLGSDPSNLSRWQKVLKSEGMMPRTMERMAKVPYMGQGIDRRFRN